MDQDRRPPQLWASGAGRENNVWFPTAYRGIATRWGLDLLSSLPPIHIPKGRDKRHKCQRNMTTDCTASVTARRT